MMSAVVPASKETEVDEKNFNSIDGCRNYNP